MANRDRLINFLLGCLLHLLYKSMSTYDQALFCFIPKGDESIALPGVVCSELPKVRSFQFLEYVFVKYPILNLA